MHLQLVLGFLLTMAPISELRGGLPVVLEYAIKNNQSIWPYFLTVLTLNIFVVILAFALLDIFHSKFMKREFYKKFESKILAKTRAKAQKLEKRMSKLGYLALMLFVSVPFPGTGAWTGTMVAWTMGLNRKKSIISISGGIVIAGLIMLSLSLGLLAPLRALS